MMGELGWQWCWAMNWVAGVVYMSMDGMDGPGVGVCCVLVITLCVCEREG